MVPQPSSHCDRCYSKRIHWSLKPAHQRYYRVHITVYCSLLMGCKALLAQCLGGNSPLRSSNSGHFQSCCHDPHLLAQELWRFAQNSLSSVDEFLTSQDWAQVSWPNLKTLYTRKQEEIISRGAKSITNTGNVPNELWKMSPLIPVCFCSWQVFSTDSEAFVTHSKQSQYSSFVAFLFN